MRIERLTGDDILLGRATFQLMVEVFEEGDSTPLSDSYLQRLLGRPEFWALAALDAKDVPIAGITAHALPMTRSEQTELFIYDLAVHADHQRRGIGRALVQALRKLAAEQGITVSFVPADLEDDHALEFYRALGGDEAPVRIFTFE